MKLLSCLLLAICALDLVLGSKCIQSQSKNCVIVSLTPVDGSSNVVSLPDLYDKTSLQIKGGNLATFSEKMANQLKSVQRLQLGPLGLQELSLNGELLEVTATDNQIHVVKFKYSDEIYKLQKLDLQRNRLKHLGGFEVLKALHELHLEDNQLETLDCSVLEQMKQLEQLHLDRNQLTSVVAPNGLDLPALEYLSLAGNKLTKLDVSSWKLESLAKWDVSANELIYIDGIGIEKQFPSLQTVLLSNNGWHCKWLDASLSMFHNNSVTVADQDEGAECEMRGGVCCASVEILVENGLDRVESISQDQKNLREVLEKNIENVKEYQDNKLKDLKKLVNDLQEKSKKPLTPTETFNLEEFNKLKVQAEQLKQLLQKELQIYKRQQAANDRNVKNMEYTILQLRKSLQHEVGKIGGLQKQFGLLKETVNKSK